MLTYNRFNAFKKAFDCYLNQTYGNIELIIVNSGDSRYQQKVEKHILSIVPTKYKITHILTEKRTIGELRNIAIDYSIGEYIIIFDDDDYHHPNRISQQMELCLKSAVQGTILRNFIASRKILFHTVKYYCTILKGLEGTLLFKRGCVRYPEMNQGEDTTFVNTLNKNAYSIAIIDEPYEMYTYNFYGGNTVSKKHFVEMVENNKPLRK